MTPATAPLAPSAPPSHTSPAGGHPRSTPAERPAPREKGSLPYPPGTPAPTRDTTNQETHKSPIDDLTEPTRQDHEPSHPTVGDVPGDAARRPANRPAPPRPA